MTTPNIEELIASLTQTNQFHESADICTADVIDALQSQAERIKVIERESEMRRIELHDVMLESDQLRAQLAESISNHEACKSANTMLLDEIAAIAATEPVAWRWVWKSKPWDIEGWCYTNTPPNHPELQEIEKLFTHPMPAQDKSNNYLNGYCTGRTDLLKEQASPQAQGVAELVDALEKLARLGNGEHYGNSDGNMIARDALSKYKGAK